MDAAASLNTEVFEARLDRRLSPDGRAADDRGTLTHARA